MCCVAGCEQLQRVILKLVKESFGDAQYGKSLDCLRSLRRECSQVAIGLHMTINIVHT